MPPHSWKFRVQVHIPRMLLNGSGTPLSTSQQYIDFSVTSHSAHEPPANDRAAAAASAYLKTVTRNLKTEFPLKSCKQSRSSELRLARRAGPWRCLPARPLTPRNRVRQLPPRGLPPSREAKEGGRPGFSSPKRRATRRNHPSLRPAPSKTMHAAPHRAERPAGCASISRFRAVGGARGAASGERRSEARVRGAGGRVKVVIGRMQACIRRGGAGWGRSCGIRSAGYLRRSYTRLPLQLG